MKERPILFSAPMVRAILDGNKTQTRRAVKMVTPKSISFGDFSVDGVRVGCCPYGQLGDQLWVRETWAKGRASSQVYYRASHEHKIGACFDKWTPSIHMPRWASRIQLEITGLRVERLQDISEEDAKAEGCAGGHGSIPDYGYNASPDEHFMHVWASAYGEKSWHLNPWVWVIEFRRVK